MRKYIAAVGGFLVVVIAGFVVVADMATPNVDCSWRTVQVASAPDHPEPYFNVHVCIVDEATPPGTTPPDPEPTVTEPPPTLTPEPTTTGEPSQPPTSTSGGADSGSGANTG